MRSGNALLLSTDKAVHPVNVLGLTKLAAETIWRAVPAHESRFTTMRFGNVLGSRGSVLEVFQRQLARGAPLSLTDRRMRRFFSTIEECASWILRAIELAEPNRLFVLDSGRDRSFSQSRNACWPPPALPVCHRRNGHACRRETRRTAFLSDDERPIAVRDGSLLIVDRPAWLGDLTSAIDELSESIRSHNDANVLAALERFAPVEWSIAVKTAH